MKTNKKNFLLILATASSLIAISTPIAILCSSCSKEIDKDTSNIDNKDFLNTELNGDKYIDLYLFCENLSSPTTAFIQYSKEMGKKYSQNWYNSLSKNNWEFVDNSEIPINLHCSSEQQALSLYLCAWGDFWNVDLHQQKEPITKLNKMKGQIFPGQILEIRGNDYQYITNSLKRSSLPENTVTYHGVEFMENEFWDQLQPYIIKNSNGSYDYSNCVGQTIESYGFISTTIKKSHAVNWSKGVNWLENDVEQPPLKEPFVFKIFVPKKIDGVAYVSWFDFVNTENYEDQILIDKDSKYKIVDYYNEEGVNFFDLLYLGIN